jgi:hypothetical protein
MGHPKFNSKQVKVSSVTHIPVKNVEQLRSLLFSIKGSYRDSPFLMVVSQDVDSEISEFMFVNPPDHCYLDVTNPYVNNDGATLFDVYSHIVWTRKYNKAVDKAVESVFEEA